MRKILMLAVLGLTMTAGESQACGLLSRFFGRVRGGCHSSATVTAPPVCGSCSSGQYAATVPPAHGQPVPLHQVRHEAVTVPATTTTSSCPGGRCPLPGTALRPGFRLTQ